MPPRRWHHETGGELAHIVSDLLHDSGPPPVLVGITACMVCTALSSLGVGRWHEKMWRQRRADADVLASALRREAEEEILNASMAASSAMDTARDESDMSFVVESADDEDETMSIRGSETSASDPGANKTTSRYSLSCGRGAVPVCPYPATTSFDETRTVDADATRRNKRNANVRSTWHSSILVKRRSAASIA